MKKQRVKHDKLEIYTFEDFLNDEECKTLIDFIDSSKLERSKISGGHFKNKPGESSFRTSYTSSMRHKQFPYIEQIDKKISRHLGVPLELGEVTQGQRYQVGQQFKDHTDYFGKESLKGHGDRWGNRVWTFMIYLNGDCEGGHTDFKKAELNFKPKKGMAVAWRNMSKSGVPNPFTMHAGRPVTKGTKYIITKWFRQKPTGVYPTSEYFKRKYLATDNSRPKAVTKNKTQIEPATGLLDKKTNKYFTCVADFPDITSEGFKVIDVPNDVWAIIQDTYKMLKKFKQKEKFPNQLGVIYNEDKTDSPVDILQLANVPSIKKILHEKLKPILTEWSGEEIIPTMIYGIRSYKDGAILANHVDRIKTHHISAIIIVDEQSNKPWPLDIQDHNGEWHKVYAKPGQMILYESVACPHGRTEPFQGEYFRNFFVHYKLKDWEYRPELAKKKSKVDVSKSQKRETTSA